MKAKFYPILTRAIEEGLAHAYRQMVEEWEPTSRPSRDKWIETTEDEILSALDEVFWFEEEGE